MKLLVNHVIPCFVVLVLCFSGCESTSWSGSDSDTSALLTSKEAALEAVAQQHPPEAESSMSVSEPVVAEVKPPIEHLSTEATMELAKADKPPETKVEEPSFEEPIMPLPPGKSKATAEPEPKLVSEPYPESPAKPAQEKIVELKEESPPLQDVVPKAEHHEEPPPQGIPAPVVESLPEPEASASPSQESSLPTPPPTPPPSLNISSPFKGKIELVDAKKSFVIIRFDGKFPAIQSELGVYRNGRFLGSVRITNPVKPPLASADILNGKLKKGDIVR